MAHPRPKRIALGTETAVAEPPAMRRASCGVCVVSAHSRFRCKSIALCRLQCIPASSAERAPDARYFARPNSRAPRSIYHGVGGMVGALGRIIMSNEVS
jgi:hypothetical protein